MVQSCWKQVENCQLCVAFFSSQETLLSNCSYNVHSLQVYNQPKQRLIYTAIQSGNKNAHKMNADSTKLGKSAEIEIWLWPDQLDWFWFLHSVLNSHIPATFQLTICMQLSSQLVQSLDLVCEEELHISTADDKMESPVCKQSLQRPFMRQQSHFC